MEFARRRIRAAIFVAAAMPNFRSVQSFLVLRAPRHHHPSWNLLDTPQHHNEASLSASSVQQLDVDKVEKVIAEANAGHCKDEKDDAAAAASEAPSENEEPPNGDSGEYDDAWSVLTTNYDEEQRKLDEAHMKKAVRIAQEE